MGAANNSFQGSFSGPCENILIMAKQFFVKQEVLYWLLF